MESSGTSSKRKTQKTNEEKGKKKQKTPWERRLQQAMIDHMEGLGSRSRRAGSDKPITNKIMDLCKDIGDVETNIRGYELFIFHYSRRNHEQHSVSHDV